MSTSAVLGLLLLGGAGGFVAGRAYAEVARARLEAKRVWRGRKSYRGK